MSSLLTLFVLGFILTCVAVVGHGIWMVGAGLVRLLTGADRARPIDRGAKLAAPRSPVDTNQVASRVIVELRHRGMISTGAYQEIMAALRRRAAEGVELPRTTAADRSATQPDERPASTTSSPPRQPAAPIANPTDPPPPLTTSKSSEVVDAEIVPREATNVRSAAERVRRFATQTEHAKRAAADQAVAAAPRATPQVPWNRLVAAFLEEKNIRWGELVGGLLIVSCSIALVVSFWSSIAERPFLKFGVLNGVTASLFGIGLYAASRWKLPTSSQGILIIATLLVPLNCLAIAAFTEGSSQLDWLPHLGELLSVGLFASLVLLAARQIVPDWPASLTMGVMVPSVCQLVMRRFELNSAPLIVIYGFALVGLLTSIGVQAVGLHGLLQCEKVQERRGNELLKRLGLCTFSLLVALGLLLAKSDQSRVTLQWLSPLSVLAIIPIVICGSVLWLRPGAVLANHRLVGTGLIVGAGLALVGGCLLAWPQPALVLGLCVSAFLVLIVAAIILNLPDVQGVAALFLAPVIVLLVHVLTNRLSWTETNGRAVIRSARRRRP